MEDGGIECKEAESVRQCLLDIYPKVLESRRPLCYSSSDCIAAHAVEGASQTNDAALTEWTIHSMKLVRDHLTKIYDDRDSSMILHESANMFNDKDKDDLPSWADEWTKSYDVPSIYLNDQYVNDMTSLVNYMVVLRKRQVHRLDHLKPPSRLARNWYVLVVGAPLASYAVYQIVKEQMNSKLLPDIFNKISAFCEEHIFDPMRSM
jgi:sugar (pentulose or hexulose) kinase